MIYIWSEIEADVFMQPGPLEREMSRDQAYELMRDVLKGLLPSLETIARTAKNTPAKKNLIVQIEQIKDALTAAEEASRQLMPSREAGSSQVEPAASPNSEAA